MYSYSNSQIDWSGNGSITWAEFCNYMELDFAEQEGQVRAVS